MSSQSNNFFKTYPLTGYWFHEFLFGIRLNVLHHDDTADLNVLDRRVMTTLYQLYHFQLLSQHASRILKDLEVRLRFLLLLLCRLLALVLALLLDLFLRFFRFLRWLLLFLLLFFLLGRRLDSLLRCLWRILRLKIKRRK